MGLQLPPVPVPGREPPAVAPAPAAPAIKTSIVREKQVVTPPKPKQVQVTDHRQPATTSPQPLANVSQGAVDAAALDQRIEWLHEQVEAARREAEAEAVKANAAWSGANRLTRCMCFCYEPDRVRMSAVAWLAGEQLRRDAAEVVMLRLRGAVASASAELEGIRTAASPAMAAASAGCESVVQRGVGALAAAAEEAIFTIGPAVVRAKEGLAAAATAASERLEEAVRRLRGRDDESGRALDGARPYSRLLEEESGRGA